MKPLVVSGLAMFLAGALHAAPPVWPAKAVASTSHRVAVLEDRRINESSGLCLSVRQPEIFWTHNDSGGEPCVFAIDQAGKTRAKVRLREAVNFDWEDMASGRNAQGEPCLFIGDIGDNLFLRPSIQIYQIPEPLINAPGRPAQESESAVPQLWRAIYPDGTHNAESLLAHPQTGRLYVITKSDDGRCALYAFPQVLVPKVSMKLEKVVDLAFPALARAGKRPQDNCKTTAACFSPDGSHLLVSTYSSLYEWELPAGQSLAEALTKPPVRIEPTLLGQLEAACYGADGRTIWLTSERPPVPLLKVTRP